jgi:hypothetical protein
MAGPDILQHRSSDITRMSTAFLAVAVLPTDGQTTSHDSLGHPIDQDEWRTDKQVGSGRIFFYFPGNRLRKRYAIGRQAIHFPITGNQRSTRHNLNPLFF